jgi:hypothetical protein
MRFMLSWANSLASSAPMPAEAPVINAVIIVDL